MYSGITSGRALDWELLYSQILEVNLFAFAYRLFHRDLSPINGTFCIDTGQERLRLPIQKPYQININYI